MISAVRLIYEKVAIKALRRMQPKVAATIKASLEAIARDPFAHHPGVDRIKGEKDAFRLRHGDWRALYQVDRAADEVVVEDIGPRGDIYR
jgi:mRNA interferase RelE/StbE